MNRNQQRCAQRPMSKAAVVAALSSVLLFGCQQNSVPVTTQCDFPPADGAHPPATIIDLFDNVFQMSHPGMLPVVNAVDLNFIKNLTGAQANKVTHTDNGVKVLVDLRLFSSRDTDRRPRWEYEVEFRRINSESAAVINLISIKHLSSASLFPIETWKFRLGTGWKEEGSVNPRRQAITFPTVARHPMGDTTWSRFCKSEGAWTRTEIRISWSGSLDSILVEGGRNSP